MLIINNSVNVSTYGAKKPPKCGELWIITTTNGSHLTSGYLPIFGQQQDINSHHTEIHASLVSFLFLQCYEKFYSVEILNPIDAICDNKDYINIVHSLLTNKFCKNDIYKQK